MSFRTEAAARAALARVLMDLRLPVEMGLTHALRRLARRRPDAFERLGEARGAAYLVAPAELPVGFRLEPRGPQGRVRVVDLRRAPACDVRISGPLLTLIGLFDGSRDADSAFFSRAVSVEGDTEAAMALHNALEATELELADLAGAAAPLVRLAWRLPGLAPRRAFGVSGAR